MKKFKRLNRLNEDYLSEINVTPFIDILLILLIAIIVSAPLLTHSIQINLPQAKIKQSIHKDDKLIKISIDQNKKIFFNGSIHNLRLLDQAIIEYYGNKSKSYPVLIEMDQTLSYGSLIEIMIYLKNSGFRKVGLAFKEKYQSELNNF